MSAAAKNVGAVLLLCFSLLACEASKTPTTPAELGTSSTRSALVTVSERPGVVEFRKWTSARWAVPLSGLLNLKHPKAVAAGLEDREEAIEIYVYSLVHPRFGTFLVDSGVSTLFLNDDGIPLIASIVASAMNMQALDVQKTTADIAAELGTIDGVFLTHIHLDHIMGLTDLPSTTPVYIGPRDTTARVPLNALTVRSTDRLLATQELLREWDFDDSKVVDIFADGSVFAIHSPGHTPGATAYLVHSTDGPQLLLGDATHTRWGWDNGVEPGSYSLDVPTSASSLAWLKELAADMPGLTEHPGHQCAVGSCAHSRSGPRT